MLKLHHLTFTHTHDALTKYLTAVGKLAKQIYIARIFRVSLVCGVVIKDVVELSLSRFPFSWWKFRLTLLDIFLWHHLNYRLHPPLHHFPQWWHHLLQQQPPPRPPYFSSLSFVFSWSLCPIAVTRYGFSLNLTIPR